MFQSLIRFLQVGGPVVWLLLVVSVDAIAIVIYKMWQLIQARPDDNVHLQPAIKAWVEHDHTTAISKLSKQAFAHDIVKFTMENLTWWSSHQRRNWTDIDRQTVWTSISLTCTWSDWDSKPAARAVRDSAGHDQCLSSYGSRRQSSRPIRTGGGNMASTSYNCAWTCYRYSSTRCVQLDGSKNTAKCNANQWYGHTIIHRLPSSKKSINSRHARFIALLEI